MIRVLFVCHGNICRSPMAEFIFKDIVKNTDGVDPSNFYVESAAVSSEEIGNDIYPPAKATLAKHGIPFESRHARKMTKDDYERFDVVFVMDESNIRNAKRIIGSDPRRQAAETAGARNLRPVVHRRLRADVQRHPRRLRELPRGSDRNNLRRRRKSALHRLPPISMDNEGSRQGADFLPKIWKMREVGPADFLPQYRCGRFPRTGRGNHHMIEM